MRYSEKLLLETAIKQLNDHFETLQAGKKTKRSKSKGKGAGDRGYKRNPSWSSQPIKVEL